MQARAVMQAGLRSLAARRWCTGAALPHVVLVEGDAFAEDNFAKIRSDPQWVLQSMQGEVESAYWEKGPMRHENLAAWKPLSAAVHHLTSVHNLKVQGWSRHPTDTSKVVYSLLNDSTTRSSPTTVLPHYQLDKVKERWAESGPPLYFADVQGHSATFRASPEFTGQASESDAEYDPAVPASADYKPCALPELFAIVAGLDMGSWDSIRSNPPTVLQKYIDEARELQKSDKQLSDSTPVTALLNLLVSRYGCRIDRQQVTSNDLKKVTFILENPRAVA